MGPAGERPGADAEGRGRGAGEQDADAEEDADGTASAERPLRRMVRRVLGRRRGARPGAVPAAEAGEEVVVVPARAPLSPVLALAVLLLVAGAALGSWLALAGGWGSPTFHGG
ncbi:hypothetical protein O1L68_16295 [Streptomyces lydicus]|nr:hypothetical protein [Streptomyces lydicus]